MIGSIRKRVWMVMATLLALVVASTHAQLLELSGDELLDAIEAAKDGEPLLVEFYAKWDGTAKMHGDALKNLAHKQMQLKVARVEFYKYKHVALRLGVQATRTVCLFYQGVTYWFEGDTNFEELTSFVKGGYATATHDITPSKPTWIDHIVGLYKTASVDPKYLTTVLHSHENAPIIFGTAAVFVVISLALFECVAGHLVNTDTPRATTKQTTTAVHDSDDDDSDGDDDGSCDPVHMRLPKSKRKSN